MPPYIIQFQCLITWLIEINITPLTVLLCNCPLLSICAYADL